MGEVIGAIAEAFAALMVAVCRLIPVVIEVVVYLAIGAWVVVRYGVSKGYRARKEKEWAGKRWLKFMQLGAGGLCLAVLMAGGLATARTIYVRKAKRQVVRVENAAEKGDLRVRLDSGSNSVTFAVKDAGLSNIFATRTMKELTDALRQNVVVEKSGDKTNSASRAP
jgi:hypothetical protein